MISTQVTLKEWLDTLLESCQELLTGMLGFEHFEVLDTRYEIPSSISGAFLPMVSDDESVQLGVLGDERASRSLSSALMGLGEGCELSPEDIADAMGEVTNIVAGGVKSRLYERSPSIKIGLPMYFKGQLQSPQSHDCAVAIIGLDDLTIQLLTIRDNQDSKARNPR